MDELTTKLVKAALARGADIMDAVDPDDRSSTEDDLVEATKAWFNAAYYGGDRAKREIMLEAVPSWAPASLRAIGMVVPE